MSKRTDMAETIIRFISEGTPYDVDSTMCKKLIVDLSKLPVRTLENLNTLIEIQLPYPPKED